LRRGTPPSASLPRAQRPRTKLHEVAASRPTRVGEWLDRSERSHSAPYTVIGALFRSAESRRKFWRGAVCSPALLSFRPTSISLAGLPPVHRLPDVHSLAIPSAPDVAFCVSDAAMVSHDWCNTHRPVHLANVVSARSVRNMNGLGGGEGGPCIGQKYGVQ